MKHFNMIEMSKHVTYHSSKCMLHKRDCFPKLSVIMLDLGQINPEMVDIFFVCRYRDFDQNHEILIFKILHYSAVILRYEYPYSYLRIP